MQSNWQLSYSDQGCACKAYDNVAIQNYYAMNAGEEPMVMVSAKISDGWPIWVGYVRHSHLIEVMEKAQKWGKDNNCKTVAAHLPLTRGMENDIPPYQFEPFSLNV